MTNALLDLHIHTNHSCDSKAVLKDYCEKACELGLKYICFTEHIDYNKADYGYGYYDRQKFFDEFFKAKDEYRDRLTVLCGVEFSEPHIYPKELQEFCKQPYDMILGSIHYWLNDLFPSDMVKDNIPAEAVFENYWQEVYKAVSFGGFDSLAHFDFPKRYYKELIYNEDFIEAIFKKMVQNNITLEINTSTIRGGLNDTMPGKELLNIYESSGGKYVTIGSDAHFAEDLAADIAEAQNSILGKFQSTFFIQRKQIIL